MRSARFIAFTLLFVSIFICFLWRCLILQDPDFGWHIQTGRLFTTQGIVHADPFSYTMPSYHFVDHEWLSDVIIAKVYPYGLLPLQISFALFGVLSLLILFIKSPKRWAFISIFLIGATLFEFTGVRMQVLTWSFLSFELLLLFHETLWKKLRYSFPLLFLLWAQIHGGFAIGLVILGITTVGKGIEEKKFAWQDSVVLVASIAATLLNPYGYDLWVEVSKSFTDPSLRFSIQEWYPAIYFTNIAFWLYFMLSIFLVIKYRKKFSKTVLLLYFLLLLSGLASQRNLPVFALYSFFPTLTAILSLEREASKHKYGKERFAQAYRFFFFMVFLLFLPQLVTFFYEVHKSPGTTSYPVEAVSYLKQNMPVQNVFAPYDWGGFLILEFPEKKVFIDGRMPSWRNPEAPKTESQYAFGQYRDILTGKIPFEKVSDAYGIDTVMIPAGQMKRKKTIILSMDTDKHPLLKKLFVNPYTFTLLPDQLRKNDWKIIYQDKKVVIFRKPDRGS